ncbi:MAG TPA: glycosyltransferase [Candidatus Brocadiia bacterium]|nr:glycosyltransferase [Candidatus Brocadiia bacterium]
MSVSVLICVRDRQDFMAFALDKLATQLRPGDQLVLVDDGSGPEAAEFYRRCAVPCEKLLIRHESSRGYCESRNEGILAARHECVVQLDSDAWLADEGAFAAFEDALSRFPRAGALALPVHYHYAKAPRECGSLARRWILPDGAVESSFMGCGAVLRRSAVIEAGLYPAYVRYGGDEDILSARLFRRGHEVRMFRRARVIHGHEVLSLAAAYVASREQSRVVEMAGSYLCMAWESLAWPLSRLYQGWVLIKAARKGLPLRSVIQDYRIKRSGLDARRHGMTLPRSFVWVLRLARVRLSCAWRYWFRPEGQRVK